MKKFLALLLALVMLLSLCACGGKEESKKDEKDEEKTDIDLDFGKDKDKDKDEDKEEDKKDEEKDEDKSASSDSAAADNAPAAGNAPSTGSAAADTPAVDVAKPESEPEVIKYTIGETVGTDIAAVTLDWAKLAIALENTWGDDYYMPKEYDAAEDSNNPYVAPVGQSLVAITYTIQNKDRASIDLGGSFNPTFITVDYNGETYKNDVKFGAEGFANEFGVPEWKQYSSSNILLSAGEIATYKCYTSIGTDAADLEDVFEITFTLPNSKGEREDFIFVVDAEGRAKAEKARDDALAAAAAAEQAALDAALAEIDPAVAEEIKAILQGEREYTDNKIKYTIYFEGDYVSVTSTVGGYSLSNEGTYSVRAEYIYVEYENGGKAGMPYTYENGELSISYLVGL